MIDLRNLDQFRDLDWEQRINPGDGNRWPADAGAFQIPSPVDARPLRCMVSAGRLDPRVTWDHVSASRADRCPNWEEMDFLARLFFRPDETAMQLHVPHTEHVNYHPHCLHLWRPTGLKKIPVPPSWMVGPDSAKKGRKAG
jgi:hypothetical protein